MQILTDLILKIPGTDGMSDLVLHIIGARSWQP